MSNAPQPEKERADQLLAVIEQFADEHVYRRLRIRVKEHGANQIDEVLQFRELQKACRENAELADAIEAAGFGRIVELDTRRVSADTGAMVQVFNRLVEDHWER